jgi:small redox-active disulfide protein 2
VPKNLAYITVSGNSVGIAGLKAILEEVASMGIVAQEQLKTELLRRVRRGNYVPESAEPRYAQALLHKYWNFVGQERKEELQGLIIRILGPGCPRCELLTSETLSALAELQLAADVEHVRDPAAIAEYGLLATPALIINGQVRASGSVPHKEKIKQWLEEFC